MAIAIGLAAPFYSDATDLSIYTSTQTWTPAVNDIILGYIDVTASTLPAPTLTGGGFTWNLITSATFNGGNSSMYFYWTKATSATLITPVFNCTGDAATSCGMGFFTVTGCDLTNPIVQTAVTNSTNAANPAVTFASNLNTNNAYTMFVCNTANPAAIAIPTGWAAEDIDSGNGTPNTGFWLGHRINGETGTTITTARVTALNYGAIGVEIRPPAAPSFGGTLPMMGVG